MPDIEAFQPPLSLRHRLHDWIGAAVINTALRLSYRRRVAAMGWFGRAVLGPLALNRRTRANLAHVRSDLSRAEVRDICRAVADNTGRLLAEMYSGSEFAQFVGDTPLLGPGWEDFHKARAAGRPVILASAHFGNTHVGRAALERRGHRIGMIYQPFSNPAANRRYLERIGQIGKPLFPTGPAGTNAMLRFLRAGGVLGITTDVHVGSGVALDFVGKPAMTTLSTARMAVKFDALLLPCFITRNPDGLTFRLEAEAPIANGDPLAMTQALNDRISARIAKDPGQWFWAHRRWKGCAGPGA